MSTPPRHLRRRAILDLPTERIEPVPPGWKLTRKHWIVLGLVLVAFTVFTVEPVRNVFLLALVIGVAGLAEVLGYIGALAEILIEFVRATPDTVRGWF